MPFCRSAVRAEKRCCRRRGHGETRCAFLFRLMPGRKQSRPPQGFGAPGRRPILREEGTALKEERIRPAVRTKISLG
jgi:hypothetical protein